MGFFVGRGLFNRELHRVRSANAARLHAQDRSFALAECGRACVLVPATAQHPVLPWCLECATSGDGCARPAAVVPGRLSEELMQRVLTGLELL